MDSKILIKPLSLCPEYSTGGLLIFAKKKKVPRSRNSEGLSLPAYTERGEQYDTLHSQEDGDFLAVLGSYNSLVVEARGVEPLSESTSTGTSPSADGRLYSLLSRRPSNC